MIRWRTIPLVVLALATVVSFSGFGRPASAAAAQQGALLLYDSEAKSTPHEGNIETLQRLLASFGQAVTVQSEDDYRSGEMSAYDRVLVVRNAPDLEPRNPDYIRDLAAYGGSYLQIGGTDIPKRVRDRLALRVVSSPSAAYRLTAGGYSQLLPGMPETDAFTIAGAGGQAYGQVIPESTGAASPYAVSDGTVAYASDLESGTLTEIALADLLKDWLKASGDPGMYVLIKEIYPFSDLHLLRSMADKLYGAGIPFLIAVKPVFYNTDYPAMKRYLQALAYAQSRNGTVVVDAPAVAATSTEDDRSLGGKMTGFLDLLADNGIAPLGMNAPLFWAYDEGYRSAGMKFFDSVFLQPNDPQLGISASGATVPFASSPFSIPFEQLRQYRPEGGPVRQPLPMETALTFDFFRDEAQLDDSVAALSDSWIPFADYKSGVHAVQTENRETHSGGGVLFVNGKSVDLNGASEEVDGDYAYTQQADVSLKKLFSVQNRILMVVFLAVLSLFFLFLFLGYRRYKRKFYHFGGRNDAL
ncbi:hypothetical protein [Cohnella zeiphila]|uniref:DUF2334 domain-containing protein n=1 Tax=Cohnella zeiphila TaxID=2761120 RepID=A0A7X0SQK3_9BACL|nr:hypothetical protein [Cohnella zeiphila]MBB6733095.1 hypothetical protein [Cohnella zeiphila]